MLTYFKYLLLLFLFMSNADAASPAALRFPAACEKGKSFVIAAVGDVLLHTPLLIKGSKNGFDTLWHEAIFYIQSANIAYANLEGPMAFGVTESGKVVKTKSKLDLNVYTSYPAFNYPPSVGNALKKSGFDIVSTANNHALDRFSIGIDKTTQALNEAGLAHVGTRAKNSDQPWVHITNKDGFKIAWLSCTESTNDNPDKYHQILHCYGKHDRAWILQTIQDLKPQTDAIIVLPHWGEEYQSRPNEEQTYFAHQVLNAGALAVIGSHPHVLQPLQKYITKDGRATLIMYSLGNFISYQGTPKKRSTIILLLGLTKTQQGTVINGVRFVPMYMQNRSGTQDLQLMPLTKTDLQAAPYQGVFQLLPQENALFSLPIITNPECQQKNLVSY